MAFYHSTSLATVVLQDSQSQVQLSDSSLPCSTSTPPSQDWDAPKPWHEGERLSYSIQVWWYSVESTRHSLYSSLPPVMARTVFARSGRRLPSPPATLRMLGDSLSLLTHRYSVLRPTLARLSQVPPSLSLSTGLSNPPDADLPLFCSFSFSLPSCPHTASCHLPSPVPM